MDRPASKHHGLSVRCPVTTAAQTQRCYDTGCTATHCRSLGGRTTVIAGHHERGIVYLDRVLVGVDHDDEGPFKEGWEIHVRTESGDLHILFLARRSHRAAKQTRKPVSKFPWVMRSTDTEPKVWGVFQDLGDAMQMAIDPTAGRED